MVIIMSGLPKSGKSTFVSALSRSMSSRNICVVPSKFIPAGVENDSDAAISAWEMAFDKTMQAIESEPPDTAIVFDTCAGKVDTVYAISQRARNHGHKVLMIYVNSTTEACISHGAAPDIIRRYREQFALTLKQSVALCDGFKVADIDGVNDAIKWMAEYKR